MDVAIGIDLGGTKIAGAIVAADGDVLAKTRIPTETVNETTLISGISKIASELRASAPSASRIGLAAAGLIDPRAGVIVTSPNLPTRNLGIASVIEARVGLPVLLDNDANAAAFAEATIGAGVGARSVVTITIGTGIGGGIVIGGKLIRGARGFAGEIGHVVIDRNGPLCACGTAGCLEAYASGTAIARAASERLGSPDGSALRERIGSAKVTAADVGGMAREGDPFCLEIMQEAGIALGRGLANIANLLDPDRFVIGGGAGTGLSELLITPAKEEQARCVLGAGQRPVPDVVLAALGPDAGMIGAALLAHAGSTE